MSKVRVAAFSISLESFGAGREQSLENPMRLGGGPGLYNWFRGGRVFSGR